MTCSNCKAATSGHFCNICGQRLNQAAKPKESKRWLWWALGITLAAVLLRSALGPARARTAANQPVPARTTLGSVVQLSVTAICADTEQGFNEISKWQSLGDKGEILHAMDRYGAEFVRPGDSLKILELGFIKRRVRVLKTGRECFVVREAVDP